MAPNTISPKAKSALAEHVILNGMASTLRDVDGAVEQIRMQLTANRSNVRRFLIQMAAGIEKEKDDKIRQ